MAGTRVVELLTDATRPPEVRAFGHLALAHLELAHGRRRTSAVELERAFLLDPIPALEQKALVALLPFVPVSPESLASLRDTIVRSVVTRPVASLETSHLANLHEGVQPEIQAYLTAALSMRLNDTPAAIEYLKRLLQPRATPEGATIAQDAAGSIRAMLAERAGRLAEAAGFMKEVLRLEARVGLIGGSPFYSQGLERYLYAGMLERQGQTDDALRWYNSFSSNSIFDLVYLAPSHLRRGRMLERLNRPKEAADEYRQALDLWEHGDPDFQPLVEEAEQGLRRIGSAAPGQSK